MKEKSKIAILALFCAALALVGCVVLGNPAVQHNNLSLQNAVTSVQEEIVYINEVVPFAWDTLYSFGPYTSKEEREAIVGFSSDDIQENLISEGMVDLLFVKDGEVVASILGYPETLGYDIRLQEILAGASIEAYKVTSAEEAMFFVDREDGIVVLTQV